MTSTAKSRRGGSGKSKPDTARVDLYQQVTDRVMEALAAGTVPWRKPWNDTGMPVSLSTNKPYRGVNVFLLGLSAQVKGYRSPWWGTWKAIAERGGRVRTVTCEGPRCHECGGTTLDLKSEHPGPSCRDCGGTLENKVRGGLREKATHIVFWKTFEKKEIDPITGKPATGMVLRDFCVFNSEQADWPEGSKAPVIPDVTRTPHERIAAAEAVAAGYPNGPTVKRTGRAAYYRPADDIVTVPPLSAFDDADEFYSTLFHELGHSTGCASRLKRAGIDKLDHYGSDQYGKEELIAEMTAALLSGVAGLTSATRLPNTAAYIASWLDTLREDHKLVVMAAAAAQKAADHILGVTWDKEDKEG